MIVSRGRGYIFVHIPKTGGTAMALALEARAKADDILVGDTPKAIRRRGRLRGVETAGRLWKHSTLADAEGLISQDDMARLFVFTLVRNPWDRLVSYYHWLQSQSFSHPAVSLAQSSTFSAFLNAPHTWQTIQRNPYRSYVTDSAGAEHADLFIRLERFEEDVAPLEQHLGFRVVLPVANQSARARDWRGFYSEEDAALVARICADDIAAHGYSFDPD